MSEKFLVPEGTVVTSNGDGGAVDVGGANRIFLVLLKISKVIEQESIEVSVSASTDGNTWEGRPVASFAQKFYAGEYPALVDLRATPEIQYLRAQWIVNRWGRGQEKAMFEICIKLSEISQELLAEVSGK